MMYRYMFVFLLLFNCADAMEKRALEKRAFPGGQADTIQEEEPAQQPKTADNPEVAFERKLIKNGSVSFQSKDLKKTRQRIDALLSKHDAYISSDETQQYPNQIEHTLTIRIPSAHFDAFLNQLEEGDTFKTKKIEIKDVSESYYDIQTRLKTKKEIEKRYIGLLSSATSVQDILAVEKQIGELRTDIESFEGRLKVLENQISLSTLNLRLYQKTAEKGTSFREHFSEGFRRGWENFIWFFVGLTNIWPFLLVFFTMIFLARRWWKRRA